MNFLTSSYGSVGPLVFFLLFLLFFSSCKDDSEKWKANGRSVEVVESKKGFQLLRHGKPYLIKGAGGYANFQQLKEAGGNSIRIWDTNDAGRILDQAHQLGLTVNLGLWLTREKEGFDYDNKKEVEKQFQYVERQVLKYKDHPALLMWSIGNEMNKGSTNIRTWDAINEIARMIHRLDPNHPVTTALMDVPHRTLRIIKKRCPELDLLSFNAYAGLVTVSEEVEQSVWDGPYLVSEFGNKGYWEVPFTPWGAPIESTSSQKARFIQDTYQQFIVSQQGNSLGSYVFFWGYKHEKTHTWFSIFSDKGEKTETADVLALLWKGELPGNQAPKIAPLRLKGKQTINNLILTPGNKYAVKVEAHDPEGDSLKYQWEILPEVEVEDAAVDLREKPNAISEGILSAEDAIVHWKAPEERGPYRLFVKVTDGQNNIATANIPFHVGPLEIDKQPIKETFFQQLLNLFP